MCPVPHDLSESEYRHLIVSPLRIFYRVEGDTLFIVYFMRFEKLLRLRDIEGRDQVDEHDVAYPSMSSSAARFSGSLNH